MTRFRAAIFDLDGVLADSARAHFVAWKRIADSLSIRFDDGDNEALKGVDRMGSLRHILALGNLILPSVEMDALAARKNSYYLDAVAEMGPGDILPGARQLVLHARDVRLGCAVASASRNAPLLLRKLQIEHLFDYVADAGAIANPKPAPDIFLACADALGVHPSQAIGFEDAEAGVAAIKAAGMFAVGVGDPLALAAADIVYPATAAVDLDRVLAR